MILDAKQVVTQKLKKGLTLFCNNFGQRQKCRFADEAGLQVYFETLQVYFNSKIIISL